MLIRSQLRSPHWRAQGVRDRARRAMAPHASLGARRLPWNTNKRGEDASEAQQTAAGFFFLFFYPRASSRRRGHYLFSRLAGFPRHPRAKLGANFFIWIFSNTIALMDELLAKYGFVVFLEKRKEPERSYRDVFSAPRENIVCDLSECEQRHAPHVQSILSLLQTARSCLLLLHFE